MEPSGRTWQWDTRVMIEGFQRWLWIRLARSDQQDDMQMKSEERLIPFQLIFLKILVSTIFSFYVQNWSINLRVILVVLLNIRKKESCWIGISRQQNSGSHIGWKHWKGCHSAKSSWSNLHLLATAISISLKE